MNTDISLLFVGDPNLGMEGIAITRKYFRRATCLIWQRGDSAGEQAIRASIRSGKRDILLSFYSDLILRDTELCCADIALNIHPSTPLLRGVGYDILPLVQGHRGHGVTLHHMTRDIDAGEIIDVIEKDLPASATYTQLRSLNQRLCIKMLEKTLATIYRFRDLPEIHQHLDMCSEELKAEWGPGYVSRAQLSKLLSTLRKQEPDHRIFR